MIISERSLEEFQSYLKDGLRHRYYPMTLCGDSSLLTNSSFKSITFLFASLDVTGGEACSRIFDNRLITRWTEAGTDLSIVLKHDLPCGET